MRGLAELIGHFLRSVFWAVIVVVVLFALSKLTSKLLVDYGVAHWEWEDNEIVRAFFAVVAFFALFAASYLWALIYSLCAACSDDEDRRRAGVANLAIGAFAAGLTRVGMVLSSIYVWARGKEHE